MTRAARWIVGAALLTVGAAHAKKMGARHVVQVQVKGNDSVFKGKDKSTASVTIKVVDPDNGMDPKGVDASVDFTAFNPNDGSPFKEAWADGACHEVKKGISATPTKLTVQLVTADGKSGLKYVYDPDNPPDPDNPNPAEKRGDGFAQAGKATSGETEMNKGDKKKSKYKEAGAQLQPFNLGVKIRIFSLDCEIPDPIKAKTEDPPPKEQPRPSNEMKFMLNGVVGASVGLYNEPHQFLGGLQFGYAVIPRGYVVFTPEVKVSDGLTTLSLPFGFQYEFALPVANLYIYPRLVVGYAASFAGGTFHYGTLAAAAGVKYVLADRFYVAVETGPAVFFNADAASLVLRIAAVGGVGF